MIDQLRALITRHCDTLKSELSDIENELYKISEDKGDHKELAKQASEMVHKIKGSSGSIGFQDVSSLSLSLELALKELIACPEPIPASVYEKIGEDFIELADRIEALKPEQSSLFNAQIPGLTQADEALPG
nr:Hpt domain-containing protein [uncultured Cohaesibacter sp.]